MDRVVKNNREKADTLYQIRKDGNVEYYETIKKLEDRQFSMCHNIEDYQSEKRDLLMKKRTGDTSESTLSRIREIKSIVKDLFTQIDELETERVKLIDNYDNYKVEKELENKRLKVERFRRILDSEPDRFTKFTASTGEVYIVDLIFLLDEEEGDFYCPVLITSIASEEVKAIGWNDIVDLIEKSKEGNPRNFKKRESINYFSNCGLYGDDDDDDW